MTGAVLASRSKKLSLSDISAKVNFLSLIFLKNFRKTRTLKRNCGTERKKKSNQQEKCMLKHLSMSNVDLKLQDVEEEVRCKCVQSDGIKMNT